MRDAGNQMYVSSWATTLLALLSTLGCSRSGVVENAVALDGSQGAAVNAVVNSMMSDSAWDATEEGSGDAGVESDVSGIDRTVDDAAGGATATGSLDAMASGEASDGSANSDEPDGALGDASDGSWSDDASDGAPNPDASPEAGTACALFDASSLDDAAVYAGFRQVLGTYHCFHCHQDQSIPVDQAGNGIVLSGNTAGLGPNIYPPNLTSDRTGLGCWTNQQIQTAMLSGVDNEGRTLCPPMPLWGQALGRAGTPMDAGTALQIIAFLRSLPPAVNQVAATNCSGD